MTQMIRKQIYIARRQQILLTRLTKARGLSESEVIRQAIEHEAAGGYTQEVEPDVDSLDKLIEFALSRRKLGITGEPLQWNREDIYSERLDRYGHHAED
jgi:hypothetical protein